MNTAFEINDGEQTYRFEGTEIGFGTSARPDAKRWYEVHIYRTLAGQYVIHKLGATTIEDEADRHTVKVCTRAEGVRYALESRDRHGILKMTSVDKMAWREAVHVDEELLDAAKLVEVA